MNIPAAGNTLLECACGQLPRILGFGDFDPTSRTYGCTDRTFWHYRTVDFVNARFQETALVLALAYTIGHEGNRFYRHPALKEWSLAAIRFWAGLRHRDGSLDESYPNEHHFCATALSCFAVTEALLRLEAGPECDMTSTGRFLLANDNPDVSNQTAGAAAALYNLYRLTGDVTYLEGCEKKLALLLARQSQRGFFVEYDGFDAGYCTITLSFLAALYAETGRDDIRRAALRCVHFLSDSIAADGYVSPEGMSRMTQFVYPYGLSVFAPELFFRVIAGLEAETLLNPAWMDDRYCVAMTADYLLAAGNLMRVS